MTHWAWSLLPWRTYPVRGEEGASGGAHSSSTPWAVLLADRISGGSRYGGVVTTVGSSVGRTVEMDGRD